MASSTVLLAEHDELATGRPYIERAETQPGLHDQAAGFLLSAARPLRDRLVDPARRLQRIVELTDRHGREMRESSDEELAVVARRMRVRLRRDGFEPALVGECFALVREAAQRVLGKRHYASQLMGGWALLQGRLVEMETGEGKTFAATLPACTVALAGYPVHVVTVNDYLASRDAEEMGPLFRFLDLGVGVVIQGMAQPDRRAAYAQSVTYCSNKELAFDYLRDRSALARRSSELHLALDRLRGGPARDGGLVLRGLYFCIVDEADSVFIDEARTPLILSSSGGAGGEQEKYDTALRIAAALAADDDFSVDLAERSITLTADGKDLLAEQAEGLGGVWASVRAREELVAQALTALMLFHRDQHYVVSEGKVQIVDESTGRVMPDRSWEHGLHQLIEAKEGCELTAQRKTLARLTYQRLFRRYIRLAGMTGTASEAVREIDSVYGLAVVRVPLHKPSRRADLGVRVHDTLAAKWDAVADSVEQRALVAQRPVLIGTRSVRASEELSAVLTARGIAHALLNAKQDKEEAEVIARAGEPGRVTVATNMAGRGTDIRLAEGVAEKGGLHVILTEYHESRRIDRQLFGRCGRQGDPGTCEAIVSLEDEIFSVYAPGPAGLLRRLRDGGSSLPGAAYGGLRKLAQRAAERRSATIRLQNLKTDRQLEQLLAFSGRGE
ncbi:preprotein translocase subunit SecA [Ramlibacter agri]|uniref:preprotein translocase subunit SecA n=1 Tax=Ramlibacter agri TaxID=2728837 RepID=UPI00197FEEE9|nr:preprotein translocase subunit SecA [Ramlibacter agri]